MCACWDWCAGVPRKFFKPKQEAWHKTVPLHMCFLAATAAAHGGCQDEVHAVYVGKQHVKVYYVSVAVLDENFGICIHIYRFYIRMYLCMHACTYILKKNIFSFPAVGL